MKMRSIIAFAGLAMSFALPTFAQEQNAVDPQVRQQIEALETKFGEANNKHDAAALTALFTVDAVLVWGWETGGGGAVSGQQAIEKRFADNFASSPPECVGEIVQVYAVADEISATTKWSCGSVKGYSVRIYVRDLDSWKIRMEYSNFYR